LQSGATSGLDTIKNRRNGDINIETEELLPKGQRDRIGAISAAMLSSSIRKVKFIVFIAHIIYICGLSQPRDSKLASQNTHRHWLYPQLTTPLTISPVLFRLLGIRAANGIHHGVRGFCIFTKGSPKFSLWKGCRVRHVSPELQPSDNAFRDRPLKCGREFAQVLGRSGFEALVVGGRPSLEETGDRRAEQFPGALTRSDGRLQSEGKEQRRNRIA